MANERVCCDLHGRNCEPPGDLCCGLCTEASHDMTGFRTGTHADGSPCSNRDLSGNGRALPGSGYVNRCGVCDCVPDWVLTRVGDVVTNWACAAHLHEVAVDLQRDHEVTKLEIKFWAKAVEHAEINRMITKGFEG